MVRFHKTNEIWFFLAKIEKFILKKNLNVSKVAKFNSFFVQYVSKGNISQNYLFHLNCESLWLKIKKILELEKLENMMKQGFLKKRRFRFLEKHLY